MQKKILKYLLPITLFLFTLKGYSQSSFKRKYYFPTSLNAVCVNAFELPNGNIVLFGLRTDTLNNVGYGHLTVLCTNAQGNVLWNKNYGNAQFQYLDSFGARSIKQDSNGFYLTACIKDTALRYKGVLMKFDNNGDTIWQKIFTDSNPLDDVIPLSLTKSVDGGFLITGYFQNWSSNPYNRCLVIKTDGNGNELWRKKISKNAPDVQIGGAIVQDSSSKKILIVGYQYIGSATNASTYSNILILDSLGTKLIQTTFNTADGGGFYDLIQLKDKNFLTCGSENANNDFGIYSRLNSAVVKFDTGGNIIWKKTFDTLSLYNLIGVIQELPNGDILLAGTLDTMKNYGLPELIRFRFFRINKDGDLKWKKYIGSSYNHSTSEGPRSVSKTSDGGYIYSTSFPYSSQHLFSILKIDSSGCDTLQAYCRMMQEVGISNFNKLTGFQFEVYPNPSKDYINIKLDAPTSKKFRIQICDISGKEIENYTVQGDSELTINTGIFEQGVYFISLFSGKDVIDRQKMVIFK